jgi:hypothetical protein
MVPESPTPTPASRSFLERFLRVLLLGALSLLVFYLKILGGILKIGIRAIRKAPLSTRKDAR